MSVVLFLNTANVHKKSELQPGIAGHTNQEGCSLILLMCIKNEL